MKDGFEHQRDQALVKLKNVETVQMITQLIFSVSLVSIFFWHDFNKLSNAIDKSYIFLLCNGILVFLAKYSGLIRSLSTSNGHEEILSASENISMAGSSTVTEIPLMEGEDLVQTTGSAPGVSMESIYPILQKDEDGRRTKKEDVDDDDEGEVSAEELNRKFDEFIRRMKEEIRTEAQDQPRLVLISSEIKHFQ